MPRSIRHSRNPGRKWRRVRVMRCRTCRGDYMKHLKLLIFLVLVITFLLPATSRAAPFLICDPQTEVTEYIIDINGTELSAFSAEADGSMRYDLQGLAEGSYTVKAKAGNLWGWSAFSDPFVFNVTIPLQPSNVKITL